AERATWAAEWVLSRGGRLGIRFNGAVVIGIHLDRSVVHRNPGDPFPQGEQRVVELELPELPGLTAEERAHLDHFPHLESLAITSDGLTDDALLALPAFPELTTLTLRSSRLTDRLVEYVKRLPKLQRLYLERVPFTDAGLTELVGQHKLKLLNIRRGWTT